jgi:cysteinyl-tRNA synthetase
VTLRLYDTAAGAVRDFVPLHVGAVANYVCGLSVQS